jgi:ABC-type uncharacterized transport system substrate-binding protein
MDRRRFLLTSLAGAFAAPLAAEAQPRSVPRVGVLSPGKPPPDDAFRQQERFEAGLHELGWTPGSNIVIDYRYADGNLDRLPALASELVRIPVNVIVARGLTIRAAREATTTIPIVMAADPDPVRSGFVVSLARPGGNITGLSTQAPDLEAKQVELLRQALPSLARVGVLANANSPKTEETTRLEAVTRALHVTLTESRISKSCTAPGFLDTEGDSKVAAPGPIIDPGATVRSPRDVDHRHAASAAARSAAGGRWPSRSMSHSALYRSMNSPMIWCASASVAKRCR